MIRFMSNNSVVCRKKAVQYVDVGLHFKHDYVE